MIGFKSRAAGIAALLLIAGCASKSAEKYGEAGSGGEAWTVADRMTEKTSSTEIAIQKAKQFSEDNIANAETLGFKQRVCRVENRQVHLSLNMEQGSLQSTNRALDIAIQGAGFLRVKTKDERGGGYAYTRNGNLFRNENGDLTLGYGDGLRLDPPINIPINATDISISQSGVVQVRLPGSIQSTVVGQMMLSHFICPESLDCDVPVLFYETKASGQPIIDKPQENGAGAVIQNELESSNVDVVREMRRIEYLDRWRAAMLDRW